VPFVFPAATCPQPSLTNSSTVLERCPTRLRTALSRPSSSAIRTAHRTWPAVSSAILTAVYASDLLIKCHPHSPDPFFECHSHCFQPFPSLFSFPTVSFASYQPPLLEPDPGYQQAEQYRWHLSSMKVTRGCVTGTSQYERLLTAVKVALEVVPKSLHGSMDARKCSLSHCRVWQFRASLLYCSTTSTSSTLCRPVGLFQVTSQGHPELTKPSGWASEPLPVLNHACAACPSDNVRTTLSRSKAIPRVAIMARWPYSATLGLH